VDKWKTITSDKSILDAINGYQLNLPPNDYKIVFLFRFDEKLPLKPLPEGLSSKLEMLIFLDFEMSSIFF
jgi:hypothetical protein